MHHHRVRRGALALLAVLSLAAGACGRSDDDTEFRSYRIVDGAVTEESVEVVDSYA